MEITLGGNKKWRKPYERLVRVKILDANDIKIWTKDATAGIRNREAITLKVGHSWGRGYRLDVGTSSDLIELCDVKVFVRSSR